MAVFTPISESEAESFLQGYDIGRFDSLKPIAEGIENTNYFLRTSQDVYVLTIFERRTPAEGLPFVIDLMGLLAQRGLPVPQPLAGNDGRILRGLAGKTAMIVTFLHGRSVIRPDRAHCHAVGAALARLHLAAAGWSRRRDNPFGFQRWPGIAASCAARAGPGEKALIAEIEDALDLVRAQWPDSLPQGACHTDLFPDNVFFEDGQLSGLIDFYFACTDALAYDLAVCIASWCFTPGGDFDPRCAEGLIEGYESLRPLEWPERASLPLLCLGAGIRFTLTRLYDRLYPREDALVTEKDPHQFAVRMHFFLHAVQNREPLI